MFDGRPPALDALLGAARLSFPWPMVVAQHMPETFTAALARRLGQADGASPVIEVRQPTPLAAGRGLRGAAATPT